jgi:hypothetical protein
MGEHVHEWLGDRVYTIAFCAYEGTHGVWRQQGIVAEPQQDSFEDVLHRYGRPLLFLDLRRKGPFDKPMLCGTMGFIRFLKAPWPEVVDAIFYTEDMQPTSFIGRE